MDKGRVLDAGKHEALMQRCDFYQDMVEAQNKVDRWNVKDEEQRLSQATTVADCDRMEEVTKHV